MADQQEDLIIDFGKHRGESLRKLALSDRNYVTWVAQQDAIKGSRQIPKLAARILSDTADAASKLDEFDLDPRYREEYSADEIEQVRRERQADAEQDAREQAEFNEAHLVDKWSGSGVTIEVDVFGFAEVVGKPIAVYIDDMTDDNWEYVASDLRDLTDEERADLRYAEIVAVLDNKVGPRIGLTQARKERLLALLTRYGLAS